MRLHNCHTHAEGLGWSHASSLTVASESVSSTQYHSGDYVDDIMLIAASEQEGATTLNSLVIHMHIRGWE